ncbi:MAG TPA: helix-turn-helix domain-containing protein [Frankiaceae bacterium]|nr:helix-turn-helix domain-containing protein [Frankiaceae bacterium]
MKAHTERADMPAAVLVERARGSAAEAQRDADVLRFVGRFRFVTDELLAERFGVSRQQINLRVRRLAAAGLLQRTGQPPQPRLAMLTRRGARAVGLPLRRAPRTDVEREHELALVWLVIQLERADQVPVRTERECRTLDSQERRYSVTLPQPGRAAERRWPDLVLDGAARRSALELELSAKGTTRLQGIVDAYALSPVFDEVLFLAADVAIARRRARAIAAAPRPLGWWSDRPAGRVELRVIPWPRLSPEVQRAIVEVARSFAQ